jgi:hypothetical protein
MSTRGTALRGRIAEAIALLAEPVQQLVPALLSSDEFIAALTEVEALGRLVDAARCALAGEAPNRVGGAVDTLAALGYASDVDAVASLTGASDAEAARRILVGRAINPGLSLSGCPTAPARPAIAEAVRAGTLGMESAVVLIRELGAIESRVEPGVLQQSERGLVECAAGADERPPLRVDLVRIQAKAFVAAIDPDGARPREQRARQGRRLHIGTETVDGLIPVRGLLVPEVGASMRRLVDAYKQRVAFTVGADAGAGAGAGADDGPDAVGVEATADSRANRVIPIHDSRTPDQRRHDALADILSAAARVADAPDLAGASPAVIVTVTRSTLDERRGVGFIDGLDTPVSIDTIERLADSRGVQPVTMSDAGKILALGSTQRCFTASQRRAITARDGGCVIPGCPIPAGWCEAHHVTPHRDGGATHVDNAVLLCWGHHQKIDAGPWRLSMPGGVPHVRGPGHPRWTPTTKSRAKRPLRRTG